jgi:hypothetical protein
LCQRKRLKTCSSTFLLKKEALLQTKSPPLSGQQIPHGIILIDVEIFKTCFGTMNNDNIITGKLYLLHSDVRTASYLETKVNLHYV